MATITHEDWRAVADGIRIPTEAIVDGEQVGAADRSTFPCVSPIDGRVLGEVASCGPVDVPAEATGHLFPGGHDADMIVAIETGGMYDRLIENRFDETNRAILLHLKGQPARSTRRFLKRLNEESDIPVVVFTDGDPWSFRIFASVAYGAIKTAHISEYLATPSARYLGITPSDIVNYDLPSDKLSEQDEKALEAELTDPRFADEWWKGEIELQLSLKKKSEQQALAKYGLDFVTDTYLPEKLSEMGII